MPVDEISICIKDHSVKISIGLEQIKLTDILFIISSLILRKQNLQNYSLVIEFCYCCCFSEKIPRLTQKWRNQKTNQSIIHHLDAKPKMSHTQCSAENNMFYILLDLRKPDVSPDVSFMHRYENFQWLVVQYFFPGTGIMPLLFDVFDVSLN